MQMSFVEQIHPALILRIVINNKVYLVFGVFKFKVSVPKTACLIVPLITVLRERGRGRKIGIHFYKVQVPKSVSTATEYINL